ncbi:hypothetical protein CORC01_00311 [Colletotrichum orchidophilum]|uniref:Uncharacterized protein n=1 Tax=Colletotrichum orchidophilum TaxID=1209926 RepID=A0A1G4BSR9_9PEZI|nr:uncharacterized protein CORC01_00311 [Colletotrichum orchidophilum]OHF04459.1 hypothetical protein CORC01_00311 [Colletotrichum orchidophilum]
MGLAMLFGWKDARSGRDFLTSRNKVFQMAENGSLTGLGTKDTTWNYHAGGRQQSRNMGQECFKCLLPEREHPGRLEDFTSERRSTLAELLLVTGRCGKIRGDDLVDRMVQLGWGLEP